jgi:alpha-L-fucosidase 2
MSNTGMTMRYPATRWQDALPTGSGIVGALLYGNVKNENIVLNHDGLFYPAANPPVVDVSAGLPKMRELISKGKCREAAKLLRDDYDKKAKEQGLGTKESLSPYQPFCTLSLSSVTDGPFADYRRGLDFSTAKAWVKWKDARSAYQREVFVSRVTDTIHVRIKSDVAGSLNYRLSLGPIVSEQGDEKNICHSSFRNTEPSWERLASVDDGNIMFQAKYPNGYSYGALGEVKHLGGDLRIDDGVLVVSDADEIQISVSLYLDRSPEEAESQWRQNLSSTTNSFDEAYEEHIKLHKDLFDRVSLNLGSSEEMSNEELLLKAYDNEISPAVVQKMFDYGRYLLIASSRAGGEPSNLQGIWNGDYAPAWNCDIHTDENVQMNYWQAMPAGLPETALPLFEYFESYMDDFRENARVNYGCRGIQVPLAMTRHGKTNPHSYGYWTGAAAWLGQHFYDYFLFTGDQKFLRERVIPWLKEVALFYEDFLVESDDGQLHVIPSLSPENRPSNGNSMVAIDATMDVALCREVLKNLSDGCDVLGIEIEGVKKWREMRDRLPAYKANEEGAIREWLHTDFDDNYHHRHQSHLYPLFPGLEITKESDPETFEACRVAVEKRLVIGLNSQTGWSMAHMANIYARLGEGDRSLECLEILLRSSTGANLFTYHNDWRNMGMSSGGDGLPPFQIDANMGISSAVLEMLAYSRPGQLKLLPALPTAWPKGSMKGLRARGGLTVNIDWNRSEGELSLEVTSQTSQEVEILVPEWAKGFGENRLSLIEGVQKNLGA